MPLSCRWQLWVRVREGPPLPQSANPGPRACEYERHSSLNRQWSATVLPPLMARGPPRSNICGMRMSSLASPTILVRGSCHLRTSCRVGSDLSSAMSAKPPLPSKGQPLQGKVYLHPHSPLIGGKAVVNYAVCYSAKGGHDSKRCPLRDDYVRLRYSSFRSVPSLRRDCPHYARSSLKRTDSATLHGFPRSHLSLTAKASFLSPCLQSHLP